MDKKTTQEALDLINRVRVTLSGVTIEAKSASDIVMMDSALDLLYKTLSQELDDKNETNAIPVTD